MLAPSPFLQVKGAESRAGPQPGWGGSPLGCAPRREPSPPGCPRGVAGGGAPGAPTCRFRVLAPGSCPSPLSPPPPLRSQEIPAVSLRPAYSALGAARSWEGDGAGPPLPGSGGGKSDPGKRAVNTMETVPGRIKLSTRKLSVYSMQWIAAALELLDLCQAGQRPRVSSGITAVLPMLLRGPLWAATLIPCPATCWGPAVPLEIGRAHV